MDVTEASTDHQQITLGIFENYLYGHLKDATLRVVSFNCSYISICYIYVFLFEIF